MVAAPGLVVVVPAELRQPGADLRRAVHLAQGGGGGVLGAAQGRNIEGLHLQPGQAAGEQLGLQAALGGQGIHSIIRLGMPDEKQSHGVCSLAFIGVQPIQYSTNPTTGQGSKMPLPSWKERRCSRVCYFRGMYTDALAPRAALPAGMRT